jgi:hypothetical protein
MTAHAQVSDVIKKDYACGAAAIDRVAQKGTHDHVGSSRFVYDR